MGDMSILSQAQTDEGVPTQDLNIDSLKIPKSNKITAQQINEISSSRKASKKRERRLRKAENATTKRGLDSLSDRTHVLKHANTIDDIDAARQHHRNIEDELKKFETVKPRIKDLHTQSLRTTRAWTKVTSHERRYIKEHVKKTQPPVAAVR
ncbi:hypothetical protein BGZ76_010033 [Entomortierella beljakovae]|nr:hypothetical protein BGZ76_010033 [Entomortierella beljakovae]